MRSRPLIVALAVAAVLVVGLGRFSPAPAFADSAQPQAEPHRLAIVWTSGDPHVAHRMTLMYAGAAQSRDWFGEVRLVVWGPSQRLVVADKEIRASIEGLIEAGVTVEACLACADSYGIADDLRGIEGLEVKYMGEPLSEFLKSDEWEVITF